MTHPSWTLETLSAALSETNNAEAFCEKNFECLGGGAYRNVFKAFLSDGTPVAVKTGSAWANSREVNRYNQWKSKEMAAILSHDKSYRWVIMEFVPKILNRLNENKYQNWWYCKDEALENLKKFLNAHDIGDAHAANVGFREDGTACIVDYAG